MGGMDRRTFLGAGAAAAAAALAGCSTAVGAVAPPDVPEEQLSEGGWERTDQSQETVFEREMLGTTVEAKSHTLVYEDAELRQRLNEKTLGNVQSTVTVISVSHVDVSGDVDGLPGIQGEILSRTEAAAREQFRARMEDEGLENVERTGTGELSIDTGEGARLTTYAADFPVDSFSVPVGDSETLTIEGGSLGVRGDLAVWHHDDYVLIAGGVHPAENFTRQIEKDLTSAITVDVDIDLGLTPEQYREEVRGILTAVE